MAPVLSILARNFANNCAFKNLLLRRNVAKSLNSCKDVVVRDMSTHKRTMIITPSRFQWNKFKDQCHLYIMLGAVPLGLLILYVNIFIGPAELSEIPEGYEPQNWEYYKHPIKRWFAKYVYTTDQEYYEKLLAYLVETEERKQIRLITKNIDELMARRSDYKGWYYKPITGKYHRIVREETEAIHADWQGQNEQ